MPQSKTDPNPLLGARREARALFRPVVKRSRIEIGAEDLAYEDRPKINHLAPAIFVTWLLPSSKRTRSVKGATFSNPVTA